jgi:hypothetical protein
MNSIDPDPTAWMSMRIWIFTQVTLVIKDKVYAVRTSVKVRTGNSK